MKTYAVSYSKISHMGRLFKAQEEGLGKIAAENKYERLCREMKSKNLDFEIRLEQWSRRFGMYEIVKIDYGITR